MDRTGITGAGTVSLRTVLVYGAVGVAGTLVYLGLTLGLVRLGAPPPVANVVGFVVAVLVSYGGHHRLTFARRGGHQGYFVRFVVVTMALLGATTLWTWFATDQLGVTPDLAALAVVVFYPLCSYFLNALWTFR